MDLPLISISIESTKNPIKPSLSDSSSHRQRFIASNTMIKKLRKASFPYIARKLVLHATSHSHRASIKEEVRYPSDAGLHPWHDSVSRLIKKTWKKRRGGERKKKTAERRKERTNFAIEATSYVNPVFRILLSTNNDSVAIPLQRACTPPQRRRLFAQLSMRRTQVELLSSSQVGTMTWWQQG